VFIKDPTAPHMRRYTTLWTINVSKCQSQTNAAINGKLLGTVDTYLSCGGILNNQIKKGLLLSLSVEKI